MALATQCPHCHTTFRVAHDQLKLRAGLVRCGACKQIFNGIENLLRADEPTPATPPPPAPEPVTSTPPDMPAQQIDDARHAAPTETEPFPTQVTQVTQVTQAEHVDPEENTSSAAEADISAAPHPAAINDNNADPLLRMTLMDFSHASNDAPEEDVAHADEDHPDKPDSLELAIDDLQRKPWRGALKMAPANMDEDDDELDLADDGEFEEPSFVKQGRRRQRTGHALRIAMIAALPLLLAGALAQGAYTFRDQLAARFPQTKPLLVKACAYTGCQVGLPTRIDVVSIESSELQALAGDQNAFSLAALLRNRGETVQAWPNIELTLNDADENAIARRVFAPRDYLPRQQEIDKGFAPKSEQSFKLFFELAQLKASGYRVYLFYP